MSRIRIRESRAMRSKVLPWFVEESEVRKRTHGVSNLFVDHSRHRGFLVAGLRTMLGSEWVNQTPSTSRSSQPEHGL